MKTIQIDSDTVQTAILATWQALQKPLPVAEREKMFAAWEKLNDAFDGSGGRDELAPLSEDFRLDGRLMDCARITIEEMEHEAFAVNFN